jgi:hypothetical protein
MLQQEVLGRTNRLLSLIRHGPHWKRRVQQFFYCCMCMRYRGNVSTEPMPSNDKGFLPSRCLATIGRFLPSRCLATIGRIHGHTHRQQRDLISLLCYFKIRKVGQKRIVRAYTKLNCLRVALLLWWSLRSWDIHYSAIYIFICVLFMLSISSTRYTVSYAV